MSLTVSDKAFNQKSCKGSPGERIGYPLQYSWVQMVKILPPVWETGVLSLDWEDPLEEGMATHSSILVWKIPMDRGAWRTQTMDSQKSGT